MAQNWKMKMILINLQATDIQLQADFKLGYCSEVQKQH